MNYPTARALTPSSKDELLLNIITGFFNNGGPTNLPLLESNNIGLRKEGFRTFLVFESPLPQKVWDSLKTNGNYWVAPSYRQLGKIEVTRLY